MQQDSCSTQCPEIWSDLSTVGTIDADSTLPVDGVADVIVHNVRRASASSLLVESLIEQLCKLLEPDPVNQKTLYEVICAKLHQMKLIDKTYGSEEFGVIRSHYQRELLRFLQLAKSTIIEGADSTNSLLQFNCSNLEVSRSLVLQGHSLNSRYSTDYTEVEFLAKGGFGEVYKARHKLDGEEYAIKKIWLCFRNKSYFIRSLQEVKLLARLNHPNIVSYKAAWLEPVSSVCQSGHGGKVFKHVAQDDHQDTREEIISTVESEEDSGGIVFRESLSELSQKKNRIQYNVNCEERDSCSSTSSSSRRALCKFKYNDEKLNLLQPLGVSNEWAILYIQMQFCEGTLRHWLDERNSLSRPVDLTLNLSIFRQIVNGIKYIHSQGIVHHDIKPSNIFINKNASQIQVGDLGLACIFQHSTQELKFMNQAMRSLDHRGEIGTKLYAAPEQLKGECNPKSDIYSLGIVLFELIQPFSTEMERSKILSQLREGSIPLKLKSTYPDLVQFGEKLMATDPAHRLSLEDILTELDMLSGTYLRDSFSSHNPEETIRQLRENISEKNLEIQELKRRIKALESCR